MTQNQPERKKSFDIADLGRIWAIIRKNWWIAIFCVGISGGLGYLYVYKEEKVYSSSTVLLLKNNDEYNQSSVINDQQGYYGGISKTFIDNSNEIRVLQSQDLIEEALERLDFDVSYYLVGRIRTTEVYTGVPFSVKIKFMNEGLYEQLISMSILSSEEYELEYIVDGKAEKTVGKFNTELVTPLMHITVRRNPAFAPTQFQSNTSHYKIQPHRKETLAASLLSRLTVENPQYTNVLKITLRDVLPERATKFLDTLSYVYIQQSVKSRFEVNDNTLYYIDRQMAEVENILDNIEDSLQLFRETNDVIDLDKQANLYFQKYSGYDDQKHNAELQLMALDDLEKYIIEDKDASFLPPSTYLLPGDQFELSAVTSLYEKQNNLNYLLTIATPDNYSIQQIRSQIDSTKRDILIYITNARQALREKTTNIEGQIGFYDNELGMLPIKQRGLLNIMRLQRGYQDMYVFLLQKRANTVIGKASIVPLTKVIERPRVSGLVSPDERKIMMSFLTAGLLIAALLIMLRVLVFNKVESYAELKAQTSLPIVGEVIHDAIDKNLMIAVESSPKSALAESFRTIRTNLQYMSKEGETPVIVITSSRPGEGKTFCSLNLAAVFAKGGRRCVILELDLHKPRIGAGLNLTSSVGISTITIGKTKVEDAILGTSIDKLSVLLSGPLPPNPSELVSSREMEDIITYCKENYELVIIDTPPVGLISDAIVLMKYATLTLFVINTKFTSRTSLNLAHEIAAMNPEGRFAFILNGVKQKRSRYYYNRYSYSYGYGSYGGGYGSYGSYGGYRGGGSSDGKKSG